MTLEARVFLIPPDGAEWHNRKLVWETDKFLDISNNHDKVLAYIMKYSLHNPGYSFEHFCPFGQLVHGVPTLYICPLIKFPAGA